mmetsp:Transcript_15467/g.35967  ORF Transcript_15467/g.35967 Transcript_15467/m.35967 type:complete len:215 (+) Transcript_15467:288-932(+)
MTVRRCPPSSSRVMVAPIFPRSIASMSPPAASPSGCPFTATTTSPSSQAPCRAQGLRAATALTRHDPRGPAPSPTCSNTIPASTSTSFAREADDTVCGACVLLATLFAAPPVPLGAVAAGSECAGCCWTETRFCTAGGPIDTRFCTAGGPRETRFCTVFCCCSADAALKGWIGGGSTEAFLKSCVGLPKSALGLPDADGASTTMEVGMASLSSS